MQNFQDTFETHTQSFINVLSICMVEPLTMANETEGEFLHEDFPTSVKFYVARSAVVFSKFS